jgi:hypothetical protein
MGLSGIDRVIPTQWYRSISITVPFTGKCRVVELRQVLRARGFKIVTTDHVQNRAEGVETIIFHVSITSRGRPVDLPSRLDDIPDILKLIIK